MRGKFYSMFFSVMVSMFLVTGAAGLSYGAIVDLTLIASDTQVNPGQNLAVEAWLFPGADAGGSIDLSSAEFNVVWDTPNLLPQSGADPTLGFTDVFGFSFAEWSPADPTGAAHVSATFFLDQTVGSGGLLLMTVPLTAGNIMGPANIGYDFFMEGLGENTIWLSGTPLDLSAVNAVGTAVNVVPVPGSIVLLASGVGALLIGRRRKD